MEALEVVLRYLLMVSPKVEIGAVRTLLRREVGSESAEEVMGTVGERLIAQGMRNMLLRLLRERFGSQVDAEVKRRVAAAEGEQLERWAVRVLSAATLGEVLAD